MSLPRFVLIEQALPNRAIANLPEAIATELRQSGIAERIRPGARIAIGVGSRGIANINTIAKSVVDFWRASGAQPFIFPAMGSHGAATAEGQADVLAHYGIHEATMGVPVISSLDVVSLGTVPEGLEVFMDRNAHGADGVFLISRIKQHTDFSGRIESGFCKMMALGLGKFAGAQRYHTFGYKKGLEHMVRTVGAKVASTGKVLGALAIQEGAHHETAGIQVIGTGRGVEAMMAQEEALLAEVKSWSARLPADEIDVLIVDEAGKNISGAGMDTKVINRSVNGHYNPLAELPVVNRIYLRSLSPMSYGNAVGIGLADLVHERLLAQVDWVPTALNSLTASTPAAIRTPIHFANDRQALAAISPTVGKTNLGEVTYCRIQNTLELIHCAVSENLIPRLPAHVRVTSAPFEVPFDAHGDLLPFEAAVREPAPSSEGVVSRP